MEVIDGGGRVPILLLREYSIKRVTCLRKRSVLMCIFRASEEAENVVMTVSRQNFARMILNPRLSYLLLTMPGLMKLHVIASPDSSPL